MLRSVSRLRDVLGTGSRCISANILETNKFHRCPRVLHTSGSRPDEDRPKARSRSVILQNPFRWLSVFFSLMELKHNWDPDFSRKEFIDGTRQAISTVLSLIATQRISDLTGLVKKEALNKFIQQASEKLGYGNTQYLNDPDDIIAMPYNVHLQSIVDQKYCDIDVHFLVIKSLEPGVRTSQTDAMRILMCSIMARFHRNYSPGQLPNWTITSLDLNEVTPVR